VLLFIEKQLFPPHSYQSGYIFNNHKLIRPYQNRPAAWANQQIAKYSLIIVE
jgi:hypothetical protein